VVALCATSDRFAMACREAPPAALGRPLGWISIGYVFSLPVEAAVKNATQICLNSELAGRNWQMPECPENGTQLFWQVRCGAHDANRRRV
jgi:hypothetical protein